MRSKAILIIFVLLLFAIIATMNSCEETKHNDPSDKNMLEGYTGLNLKSQSTLIFYSLYSCSEYSKMTITKNENNEVSIINENINTPQGAVYCSVVDSSIRINDSDTLIIPNDGKQYWIVPFDPDDPSVIKAQANQGISVSCNCSGTGECFVLNTPSGNGYSELTCEPDLEGCDDCCDMRTKIPFNAQNFTKSFIIIEADKLTYSGTTYYK